MPVQGARSTLTLTWANYVSLLRILRCGSLHPPFPASSPAPVLSPANASPSQCSPSRHALHDTSPEAAATDVADAAIRRLTAMQQPEHLRGGPRAPQGPEEGEEPSTTARWDREAKLKVVISVPCTTVCLRDDRPLHPGSILHIEVPQTGRACTLQGHRDIAGMAKL